MAKSKAQIEKERLAKSKELEANKETEEKVEKTEEVLDTAETEETEDVVEETEEKVEQKYKVKSLYLSCTDKVYRSGDVLTEAQLRTSPKNIDALLKAKAIEKA